VDIKAQILALLHIRGVIVLGIMLEAVVASVQ
jgi:hypothetical protein